MGTQTYDLTTARIGKFKGDTLKRAQAAEVLARWGRQVRMPRNMSDTYVARRWLPYGALTTNAATQNTFFGATTLVDRSAAYVQAHQTNDGATVVADTLRKVDYSVVMQEYSCLYAYTAKTAALYEDAIPPEMEKLVGERVALVNELICWGTIKGTTSQSYGGTGTSIATVNGGLTLGVQQNMVRTLQAQHGGMVTSVLKPGPDYDTSAVAGGYIAVCSTDLEPDIRALAGFTPAEKYANGTPYPNEVGKCERVRYITSPDLVPRLNAGAAIGSTGLYSTAGSNIDVYTIVYMAEDGWSQVAVRGFESAKINVIPPGKADKSDPNGQRGYVGALWMKAAMIENDGWLAALNVGRKVTS